jgi:acetate kinase
MSVILTCNAGSTNTKLAAFDAKTLKCLDRIQARNEKEAVAWIGARGKRGISGMAHRVVHGGRLFRDHAPITKQAMEKLQTLTHLAPLHQPTALKLIREARRLYSDVPHIACFDTGFFYDLPAVETRLPLPRSFYKDGLRRYGFYGLSYRSILNSLPADIARQRIVIAHLGGGSSMCALRNLKPVASSMGFSTLDGMMMGTRPGALDPGVLLHLLDEYKMTPQELRELLYHGSGLKGVSGFSQDMKALLASKRPEAKEAVALYCHSAAKQLAALLPSLGGLDMLVFTGGIGENASEIRERIYEQLAWLGGFSAIMLPSDEEAVMAHICRQNLGAGS